MSTTLTPEQRAIFASGAATVTFEDHGQDFLRFHIKDRRIIGSEPFQASVWCGLEVSSFPVVGGHLHYRREDGRDQYIKYPIAKVDPLWDLSDPFKAIVVKGMQTYYCTVDDRIRCVQSFTEAQCHAALLVPRLQRTVITAVERRIRQIHKQETSASRGGAS